MGAVGDVEPGEIAFVDELVEGEAEVGAELHEAPVVGGAAGGDVGGLAEEVLGGGGSADGAVERGAAVAAVDGEGPAPGLAEGVEDVVDERAQVVDVALGGGVVYSPGRCCSAARQLGDCEVFHIVLFFEESPEFSKSSEKFLIPNCSIVAGRFSVGAAAFVAFLHLGLGELELGFVAAVEFLEAGVLRGAEFPVQAVDFRVAFGEAFFEPVDLFAVVVVLGGDHRRRILPFARLAPAPPFDQFDDALHAARAAYERKYFGCHHGGSLVGVDEVVNEDFEPGGGGEGLGSEGGFYGARGEGGGDDSGEGGGGEPAVGEAAVFGGGCLDGGGAGAVVALGVGLDGLADGGEAGHGAGVGGAEDEGFGEGRGVQVEGAQVVELHESAVSFVVVHCRLFILMVYKFSTEIVPPVSVPPVVKRRMTLCPDCTLALVVEPHLNPSRPLPFTGLAGRAALVPTPRVVSSVGR